MDGGSFFTNLNEWVKVIFSTNVASHLFRVSFILSTIGSCGMLKRQLLKLCFFGSKPQDSSFPNCLHLSKVHINKGLYCNINEQYQPILTGCWWDCDHTWWAIVIKCLLLCQARSWPSASTVNSGVVLVQFWLSAWGPLGNVLQLQFL